MGRGGTARSVRRRRPLAMAVGVLLVVVTVAAGALARAHPGATPVVVALPDQHPLDVAVDNRTAHAFVTSDSDNRIGGHVVMLNAPSGVLRRTVALPLLPGVLALDSRAARVYVVGATDTASDGAVSLLDARSGRLLHTIALPVLPRGIAVDERTGRVYIGSAGAGSTGSRGVVTVLDATTGRRLYTLSVAGDPWALAVDDRTRHLVIAGFRWVTSGGGGYATTHLTTLDARSGRVIRDLSLGRVGLNALAVDDHAGRAVALTANFFGSSGVNPNSGAVQILDTTTGALVRSTPLTGLPVALVADVRTGRLIVTHFGSARVVTTQTGPGGGVQGRSVSLVPTGKGRVSVLETRSGRLLRTTQVDGVPGAIALGVTPGRILVASASLAGTSGQPAGGGTITLLDASTGAIQRVARVAATLNERTLAVDTPTGRVFTLNDGIARAPHDPWGWIPSWLRTRLPFLPARPVQTRAVPASVTALTMPP